jgi:hypothetical protein
MIRARSFLLMLIAWIAIPAFATPQHKVATGLWIDPNESGWGLNLFHQGDTVFGALFVYGPDGQPRWYTASNMTSSDDGPLHDRPSTVSGDLFECTGPYFGAAFDPNAVTRRRVGSMTLTLGSGNADLVYSVDGVNVHKQVVRFTFRRDSLSDSYVAYVYDADTGASQRIGIAVGDLDGNTISINMGSSPEDNCSGSGARRQDGDFVGASGTYTCRDGRSGSWTMDADVTPAGFSGHFNGPGATSAWGRIAGARTGSSIFQGNGWRNDLWFPANEGGWGVNILDQGDTLFATLFVYDAQGRPHWYSASELHLVGGQFSVEPSYVGALYESTGPYFGTSFNANSVNRRQVGTMSFQAHADGTGLLTYGVDGVGVSKTVRRFAFRKNTFTGTYVGHRTSPAGVFDAIAISINDEGDTFAMDTTDIAGGFEGSCHYVAPVEQVGEQRRMAGTYSCSTGRKGNFSLSNAMVTWDGFTLLFDGNDYTNGRIEGVRREKN